MKVVAMKVVAMKVVAIVSYFRQISFTFFTSDASDSHPILNEPIRNKLFRLSVCFDYQSLITALQNRPKSIALKII